MHACQWPEEHRLNAAQVQGYGSRQLLHTGWPATAYLEEAHTKGMGDCMVVTSRCGKHLPATTMLLDKCALLLTARAERLQSSQAAQGLAHPVPRVHKALGQELAKGAKSDYADSERSLLLQGMQGFGLKVTGQCCVQCLRSQPCSARSQNCVLPPIRDMVQQYEDQLT